MEFAKVLEERYSVRSFQDKKIESEKLKAILEAARIAPTAKNRQPVRIYVFEPAKYQEKLGVTFKMMYNAPLALMVCVDTKEACFLGIEEGYNTGEMDASIVGVYMMLKAWSLGIGSVWVRYFNSKDLQTNFNLPPDIKPVFLLPIGYASSKAQPSLMHTDKKNLDEIVTYL